MAQPRNDRLEDGRRNEERCARPEGLDCCTMEFVRNDGKCDTEGGGIESSCKRDNAQTHKREVEVATWSELSANSLRLWCFQAILGVR